MRLTEGKLNISIGGMVGSEGKAVLNAHIAISNHVDVAITNAAPNAGHTFFYHGRKYIAKHLPVTGIIHTRCQIYLCAGAIINPKILLDELDRFGISHDRMAIHPRCAIITEEDIQHERSDDSSVTLVSSTQSGVGAALVRKINRSAKLARDIPELQHMVCELPLHEYLDSGCTALMEVPQGFELGINSGIEYPYCTSREISVSYALSDAQVHPSYLGKVCVCIRTFPIRVGNIVKDGVELGFSGPFNSDSVEMTWDDLGVKAELTTVTGRIRRVASFSMIGYRKMIDALRPDYVLLNFANYMKRDQLSDLLESLPEVTHLGFGPDQKDVYLNSGYFKGD